MGKYDKEYRLLAALVRSGKIDDYEPKDVLNEYAEFKDMNPTTFRAKLREIRAMFAKTPTKGLFLSFSVFYLTNFFEKLLS